jgi:hypothetical protein
MLSGKANCFDAFSPYGCRFYLDNKSTKILGMILGYTAIAVAAFFVLAGFFAPAMIPFMIATGAVLELELGAFALAASVQGEEGKCADIIIAPFSPLFIPRFVTCI